MGDSLKDPLEEIDSEDEELERPPTPDFHLGDEDASPNPTGFSDISENDDNEDEEEEDSGKEEPVRPVTGGKTLRTAKGEDVEVTLGQYDDEEKDSTVTSPVSSVSSDAGEKKDEKNEDNATESKGQESENSETFEKSEPDIVNKREDINEDSNTTVEHVSDADGGSVSVLEHEEVSDLIESRKNKDPDSTELNNENDDEDLEMAMSPIGDLGLSGTEAAIVNDILRSDVTQMLPDHESEEERIEEGGKEEDKVIEKKDVKEEKQDNEDSDKEPSSPVPNDSEDEEGAGPSQSKEDKEEESEPEEAGEQLIADIFGASDEEEEFEGFDQEDIEVTKKKKGVLGSKKPIISEDEEENEGEMNVEDITKKMVVPKPDEDKAESSDSDVDDRERVWDFDVMMEQKKANRAKRRRRGDGDIISDNDDLVVEMIGQMKNAAEEDKLLNEAKQAATKKLKMLPMILKHLNKADLQITFIDCGVLGVIKDWMSPLPDGSLPHLQIRTGLLKILSSFPALDTGALKMSGLGKSIMYIYRHPKEIRENKGMAGKLINDWARPIFGVTSNFKLLSREEREKRDYQNMSKRRRLSSTDGEGGKTPRSIDSALQGEKKALRPGDKGFVMRARVPLPSNKDYVVRPKTELDSMDFVRTPKNTLTRVDKQMRKFKDKNKAKGVQRAVTISIGGRNMSL